MAKVISGSFNTNAYGNLYLQFSWTATQSIANNQTTINWELWSRGSYSGYYKAAPITVTIAGSTRLNLTSRFDLYTNKKVGSGSYVLTHDANGAKSFSASVSAAIYSGSVNCSGEGAWDLVDIPRGATIISAPNFDDENTAVVKVSNPANAETAMCISLDGNTDITVPYKTFTGSEVTFNQQELEPLLAKTTTTNSRTVYFVLRTKIGGNFYFTSAKKTFTVINCQPTINPTVVDVGPGSTSLTGNANIMIKGFNGMRAEINATAKKGATITSIKITNGSTTRTISPVEFWYSENNVFSFSATDSRGNTATKTVTKTSFVEYVRLTCSLDKNSVTTGGQFTITARGNCFAGSFGSVTNNVRIHYRWRETGGEWGAWTALPHTISGTTYTATTTKTGLDYQKSYDVQAVAMDDIGSSADNQFAAMTDVLTVSSVPVFSWSKTDFEHNTNLVIDHNKNIYGKTADGDLWQALEPCNNYGYTSLGWGSYKNASGRTQIWGNDIDIKANNNVYINGRQYGTNKVLWTHSGLWMGEGHVANLNEAVSAQPNGIVLVWSLYRNNKAEDASFQSFFVSKYEIAQHLDKPHAFFLIINAQMSKVGAKYVYINDTSITGYSGNTFYETAASGITYDNNYFVLRYVLGV